MDKFVFILWILMPSTEVDWFAAGIFPTVDDCMKMSVVYERAETWGKQPMMMCLERGMNPNRRKK